MSSIVDVEITLEAGAPRLSEATIHVRLEEVGALDVAARVVAEQVRPAVALAAEGDEPDLYHAALEIEEHDPAASYGVRVHIDVDGDGEVSTGDFITMESYPVLTFGYPSRVAVVVRCIT